MNYIKKFESFGSTVNYYYCDECDGLWTDKDVSDSCTCCGNLDIDELSEVEYIELEKNKEKND